MRNLFKDNKLAWFAVIFILTKIGLWFYLFPAFQTPDEPAHFGYVQFIAERNRLVDPAKDTKLSREVAKSLPILVFYVQFNPKVKINYSTHDYYNKRNFIKALNNSSARTDFSYDGFTASAHPPLYYALSALVYKLFFKSDLLVRIYAIRFFSAILSMLTLYIIYLSARILFKDNFTSLIVTLAVALQPMYSMISVSINPDNLMYFFFASFLYLSLVAINARELNHKNNLLMAFIIVLSFLTKEYAVILLFMYGLVLFFLFLRKRSSVGLAKKALISAISLAAITVVSGWRFARTITASKLTVLEYFKTQGFKYARVLDDYWGNFGWVDTPVDPHKFHDIYLAFLFLLVFGAAYAFLKERNKTEKDLIAFMLLTFLFSTALLVFVDYTIAYDINHNHIQGRYFLITLPINTFLPVIGLIHLAKKKYGALFAYQYFFLSLVFNILCVYSYIMPRYHVLH